MYFSTKTQIFHKLNTPLLKDQQQATSMAITTNFFGHGHANKGAGTIHLYLTLPSRAPSSFVQFNGSHIRIGVHVILQVCSL